MPAISANVVDIGQSSLSYAPIPSTSVMTIGSATATSLSGIVGWKYLMLVMPVTSPAGGAPTSSPVPTAKVLKGAVVGTAYSETITAQGGTAPYTFAVAAGSLPSGLSLNAATGVISGTPTTVQTADFTIQATDSTSEVGTTDFEIGVTAPVAGGAVAYGWVN